MRSIAGINLQTLIRVCREPIWGYLAAALLLIPAATVVGLYPMNWILGTVAFEVSHVELGPLRLFVIVPILIIAAIVATHRNWALAAMIPIGLILMVATPDRLGSHDLPKTTEASFYPDGYKRRTLTRALHVSRRQRQAQAGSTGYCLPTYPRPKTSKRLTIPPQLPPPDGAARSQQKQMRPRWRRRSRNWMPSEQDY